MKYLILHFLLLFIITPKTGAQDSIKLSTIKVVMEGFKNDNGMAYIALYDSSDNWLGTNIIGKIEKIKDGKSIAILENIPQGSYAISCFHDENDNKKLDTGWFGIPTEPYACSNGAKGRFGPPKWTDAVFSVEHDETNIQIKF